MSSSSAPPAPGMELSVPYVTLGQMYAATTVLPVIGIILVILRGYRRVNSKSGFGADDWLLLVAMMWEIGMAVTLLIGVQDGVIAYPAAPPPTNLTEQDMLTYTSPSLSLLQKLETAFVLQSILSCGFLKLSIVLFYRRIFVVSKGSLFDWACWISVAICSLWTVGNFLSELLDCGTHISANWGSTEASILYCPRELDISNAYVITDVITDGLVWLLPVPMIWGLHMTVPRRLGTIGILMIGAISVIASVVKVVISFEISSGGLSPDVDVNLTLSTILYWLMIESGLAIIATCLPILYPYVSGLTFESAIRSFRSIISLQSTSSTQHRGGSYRDLPENSSVARIRKASSSDGDMELGKSSIKVTSDISCHSGT